MLRRGFHFPVHVCAFWIAYNMARFNDFNVMTTLPSCALLWIKYFHERLIYVADRTAWISTHTMDSDKSG